MATSTINQSVFASNSTYSLSRPLSHSYKNVNIVKVCISTYSSTTKDFGFDISGSVPNTDLATSVSMTLGTAVNATYINIGFNVILICDGFNSLVTILSWNITSYNTNITTATTVPATFSYNTFFEGLYIATANPSNCRLVWVVSSLDFATQTAKVLWWANTTQGVLFNAVKYVRVFGMIINTGLASTILRYKYFTVGWQTTTSPTTSTINANSNKTTYNLGNEFILFK